jgi:predicted ATP-grasp superfamily ATP-dependent carboligase
VNHEVIVLEADTLTMIAVMRSLGRAGYRPHALSAKTDALGFRSRYAFKKAVHPDYGDGEFVVWLRDYVASHPVRVIVPGESFLNLVGDYYSEFEALLPDPVTRATRERCLSKAQVWDCLSAEATAGKFMPLSGNLDSAESVALLIKSAPADTIYYLKPDWEFSKADHGRPRVVRVDSLAGLHDAADECLEMYSKVHWQQHVSGLQVGVSLWREGSEFHAENMVIGRHTYPHRAGNMSLRESWWHEGILDDAKTKLEALDWSGVAMMEYVWNPEDDEFWFIEINPRYWGYLHLDLACGKDFPKWQIDAHFGRASKSLGPPAEPATMRYVAPGEIIHVASRCLDREVPIIGKLKSVLEFALLGVNPKVRADLWFAGDKRMYLFGWIRFFKELPAKLGKAMRRAGTQSRQH